MAAIANLWRSLSPALSLSLWGFGLFALKSKMRRQPGNTAVRQRGGERHKESCLTKAGLHNNATNFPPTPQCAQSSASVSVSSSQSLILFRHVIIIIFSFLLGLGLDWLLFREYVCFACPHAYSIIIRGCPAGR